MKSLKFISCLLLILVIPGKILSQTLRISSGGQTGTSGTNWTTFGGNPKYIQASSTAHINTSVIRDYLNAGTSVIVINTADPGKIQIEAPITKSAGGDATLTIRANGRVFVWNGDHITSTSGKLNVVLWSDYDFDGDGGVSLVGNLVTNGGHVWLGSSSTNGGSLTWNGLTVGNGPSRGGTGENANGLDIFADVTTNGGDFLAWAGERRPGSGGVDGIGSDGAGDIVNTGSGDIILITDEVDGGGTTSISFVTTGTFTLAPNGGSFASTFLWNPVVSGADFEFPSGVFNYMRIKNVASLGGVTIGQYTGTGLPGDSPFNVTNSSGVTISTATTVNGPFSVYGNAVLVNQNLESTADGADILLKSLGAGSTFNNGYIQLSSNRNLTTNGGDIILWSNAANRNSGSANNEIWLMGSNTLSSNGGKIVLAGGLDDGSNGGTANDGIPDGYAYRGAGNLTANNAAVGIRSNVQLLSGNGNVIIRGHGNPSGVAGSYNGNLRGNAIQADAGFVLDAGTGTINIKGLNNSDHAVWFPQSNVAITTASTANPAILIDGESTINFSGFGGFFNSGSGASLIQTTGNSGGGIIINSRSSGTSIGGALWLGNNDANASLQILSNTGDILLSSDDNLYMRNLRLYLGNRLNANQVQGITPLPTAASGNITMQFNGLDFQATHGVTASSTGNLRIEPYSDDFSSGISLNSSWTLGIDFSSLTIGKSTTSSDGTADANITLSNETSIAGPISVYGKDLTLQHNLTSTAASADISLIGSGSIFSTTRSKTISTNGGNVLFATDSDGNGSGNIISAQSNFSLTIDTRAIVGGIKSTAETGGGNITLGGGDTVASSYATGTANGSAEGIRIDQGFTARSGGGNITMRGRSWSGAVNDGWGAWGLGFWNGSLYLDAGAGKIYLEGIGRAQDNVNSFKQGFVTNNTVEIYSSNTGSDAITIKGHQISTSPNWNIGIDLGATTQNGGVGYHKIVATGAGAGIVLDGLGNAWAAVIRNGTDLVTNGGPITLTGAPGTGNAGGELRVLSAQNQWWGSRSGQYSGVVGDDLTIRYNTFNFATGVPNIAVAGEVLWEPFSNSFGQNVNTNWFSWNQNSQTMTGLTIGKATNTASITSGTAISAAGPISFYGGNITVNENLNTSAGNADGDIFLKGSGNIIQAASKSFTTNGGDVTIWADSDGNGTGYIQLTGGSNSGITSGGGHVFLGGGTTLETGYARGTAVSDVSVSPGYTVYVSGVHLRNGTSINSGGGNITLRGQNVGNSDNFVQAGIMGIGTTLDAGTGKIALYGLASGSGNANAQGISTQSIGWTIRSASAASDAIYLEGDATSCNNSATSLGVNFSGTIEATGANGGITLIGKAGTAWAYDDGLNSNGNILAASGDITLVGDNNNTLQRYMLLGDITIGAKPSTNVESSSSNVIIRGDQITFNPNTAINTSGTVTIEPAGNSFGSDFTFPITNLTLNTTVSGLTIGKPSNTANIIVSSTQTIAGPITVYGGTLAINENLTSSTGGTISLFGNALTFAADKTVTSTNGQLIVAPQNPATTIGMAGAAGTLQLPATYFSTNFTDGFANIQIGSANQTGSISTNAFNLQDNMTLLTSGSLTLGGKPVLGANNMTLGEDITTIDVGVAQNYFKSDSTGRLKRQISDGNSKLLPVGRAQYNPVTITNNTGSADVFSAGVLDSVFLNGFVGPLIETPHVKVTWDLDKQNANGGGGVDAEFGWFASQEEGLLSSYRLNHHNGTNWEFASGTSEDVSGDTFKTMVHNNYLGSFSPFAISEDGSALPVEFLGMQYDCLGQQGVSLTWQTASELNAQHFEVMRSEDGFNWEKVGQVDASGTTSSLSEYNFVDNTPSRNTVRYYQLKQVDFNGNHEWLPIISVNCAVDDAIRLYPNPAQSQVTIEFSHETEETVTLSIYDALGREVKVEQIAAMIGFNRIEFNVSELPAGSYQLRLGQTKNPKPLNLLINR